jgi:hypothetical protein
MIIYTTHYSFSVVECKHISLALEERNFASLQIHVLVSFGIPEELPAKQVQVADLLVVRVMTKWNALESVDVQVHFKNVIRIDPQRNHRLRPDGGHGTSAVHQKRNRDCFVFEANNQIDDSAPVNLVVNDSFHRKDRFS